MMNFVRSLLALLAAVSAVNGQCQVGVIFPSDTSLVDNANACTYHTTLLNETCVSLSCPALSTSGQCPFYINGTLVPTAAQAFLGTVNRCMGLMKDLCGVGWDPIPTPTMGIQVNLFNVASGQCVLLPGTGNVSGLTTTTLSLGPSPNGPKLLPVAISAPAVVYAGSFRCTFDAIPGFTEASVTTAAIPAVLTANMTAAATLSPNGPNLTSASKTTSVDLGQLPPLVQSALNGFANALVGQADIQTAFATFVATYVDLALRLVCPVP